MERLTPSPIETPTSEVLPKKTPERLCHIELSLAQIRSFVAFCRESGCKSEYDAYRAFITDVPEQDREKRVETAFLDEMEMDGLSHFWDRDFEQVRFFAEEEKTDKAIAPSVYGRLYISPSVENVPIIMQKIIEKHQKHKKDLVCKFSRFGARNDRIVIYLTEDFDDEMEIMKEIQEEFPELFAECGKNKLWCDIEGVDGIYYGSEPSNKAFSYGEDRARIIGELFALQEEGIIDVDDDEELDKVFKLECLKRRVNPFNFGFYINDDAVGSAASDVLLGYHDEDFEQEEEYLKNSALVEEWLEKNADSSKKSWLGDNVPKFGDT